MKTTVQFLNAVKKKHGLKSNYALAKFMGQTETNISRWMNGKGALSDENAMQVADLLGIEQAYVVACIHAEREKIPSVKKMWEHTAEVLYGLAAAVAVFALALTLTFSRPLEMSAPQIALKAAPALVAALEHNLTDIYIMRICRE